MNLQSRSSSLTATGAAFVLAVRRGEVGQEGDPRNDRGHAMRIARPQWFGGRAAEGAEQRIDLADLANQTATPSAR